MLHKLMLLAIAFALVMSLGIVVACDEEEDDDEDDDDDDGGGGGDDTCSYATEITWGYNTCGLVLVDADDADMTLDEALADCNTCVGQCAAGYMAEEDGCPDFFTCLEGCF